MESKPWYQSLTIWGAALTTLCGLLLPLFGLADVAQIVQEESVNISNGLAGLGTFIGAAAVIYGRIRARKAIK